MHGSLTCKCRPAQGDGTYDTPQTVVDKTAIPVPPPTCTGVWDGSITDLVNRGIPASKIVVGKPITNGDANNGCVDPETMVQIMDYALSKYPIAGLFGWQWGSDTDGSWINQILNGINTQQAKRQQPEQQ